MNPTITHIAATLIILLLIIFSAYLFFNGKKKIRNVLLAIFFLANTFYLIDYLLIPIQNVLGISLQWFDEIGFSFAFLFGPLILFFIYSIIKSNFKIHKSMVWHFLPFAFFLILYSFKNSFFCEYGYIALYIHLFIYYIASFFVLKKYSNQVKSFFSSFEEKNLSWIIYVLIAFISVTIIDSVSAVLAFFHWDNSTTRAYLNFFSVFINLFYVVYIFYKSIHIPQYQSINYEKSHIPKYSKSKLTNDIKNDILKKLEIYFTTQKPFLNPSLTISDVSDVINVPAKNISQVINELLHKNFYDFTNSYRINEAKMHLSNTQENKETILEILYKSGFNSKSSFNTAFKKHTNLTPTQFKRNLIS